MEPGPGDTMQSKTEIVPAVKKLAVLSEMSTNPIITHMHM